MIENLKKDPNKNYQADGKCLEELFLNNNEWLAINELIELLNPFALATTIIGGSFYPTLSITYPIIIQLIDNTKKNITKINNPKIKEVATELYNNIKDQLQELDITAHIASFLDPCFKNLEFLKAYQKREVHNNVQELIQEEELVNDSNFETTQEKSALSLFFGETNQSEEYSDIKAEFNLYLSLPTLSKTNTSDPLKWWKEKKSSLPRLAKLARTYLAIPSTSVPSERLFSSAGNTLTKKRNRLSPTSVHDILFLKENFSNFNIFPKN